MPPMCVCCDAVVSDIDCNNELHAASTQIIITMHTQLNVLMLVLGLPVLLLMFIFVVVVVVVVVDIIIIRSR